MVCLIWSGLSSHVVGWLCALALLQLCAATVPALLLHVGQRLHKKGIRPVMY